MPCFHPITCYRSRETTKLGKRQMVFEQTKAINKIPYQIPCGQCIGCKIDRSQQWAVRIMHESSLHQDNMFVTLTYNEENLPHHGHLVKTDVQKFMKRLRKKFKGVKIRFYQCGEYGETTGRPHYHLCIFGLTMPDKKHCRTTKDGNKLYSSEILEGIWKKGAVQTGDLTFQSAAYVARYCTKKVNGSMAAEHYERVDPITGEIYQLTPEFSSMSLKPAIGKGWLDKYKTDVYPSDEIIVDGHRVKVPRFYDKHYEITNPEAFNKIKDKRWNNAKKPKIKANNKPDRLEVREKIQKLKRKHHNREPEQN